MTDPKKKIDLLVIPDLFPNFEGDVQGIFVLDYLKSVEEYCTITVLFIRLTGKKGLTIEKIGNATVYRYCFSDSKIPSFLKPLYYIRWFLKGYSLGKKIKGIGVIHSHGTILSGTLSLLLSKKLKKPFVITEHQGPFSMISGSFWKRNWARFTMQRANKVLTVSEHLKNEILNSNINPKNIEVSYNPVDTELFTLRKPVLYKNILYAGRLDNFKGALRCLKAFAGIVQLVPEWKFTIVGDGEDALAIKNFLAEHPNLKERVVLKGKQSKAELAQEMQSADFFVFPSRHESFGLVIAEAMSCGLPVITSNQTAPREFVNDQSGVLVSPDDIEEISKAMQGMIKDLSSYDSTTIREGVVKKFSFENFGKKLSNIYQSLLNKQ